MLSSFHRTIARIWAAFRPSNLDRDLNTELEAFTSNYSRRITFAAAHRPMKQSVWPALS